MRILMVHNSAAFGGAERYTVDVAAGLVRHGHEVVFVCSPGDPTGEHLRDSDVRVHAVPMGMAIGWHSVLGPLNELLFWVDLYANPWRARFERFIRQLHSEHMFDVVHVQFIKERLWIGRVARLLDLPVVWTIHSPLEPWMKRGIAASVMQREMPHVDRVVAVSRATAKDLTEYGMLPDGIDVVYNGLDISRYADGDRQSARATLGLGDELVVLVPARPYREKGIDVLLDAAVSLLSHGEPAFKMLVAGESRHRSAYAERARTLGLGERVVFLGHRDNMPELYAAADLVCLPSYYEGLPYAISEAMAAGVPVVATPVGGIPEMVVDGVTGLLVPAGEPGRLAEAITRLFDPTVRERMGLAGRDRVEAMFSLRLMIAGTEGAYVAAIGMV